MLFGLIHMPGLFAVELGELIPVIAKVFNLLLFAGVMYFVLRRPLAEAFRARQEVEQQIEEEKSVIRAQADEARATLEGEAARIAAGISSQILGH